MSPETVQLVLAVFGLTGLLGAVIAVVKLRPEGNERAVQTSLNAVSAVDTVLEELRAQVVTANEQRDYWKKMADECHEDIEACRVRAREHEQEADEWRRRALDAEERLRERDGGGRTDTGRRGDAGA